MKLYLAKLFRRWADKLDPPKADDGRAQTMSGPGPYRPK